MHWLLEAAHIVPKSYCGPGPHISHIKGYGGLECRGTTFRKWQACYMTMYAWLHA